MKIVEVIVGTGGSGAAAPVIRELVEFSDADQEPSHDRLGDDPYKYEASRVPRQYSRARRQPPDGSLRGGDLYKALVDALDDNKLMTSGELRELAQAKRDELPNDTVQATVELFLYDYFQHAIRFCADTGIEPKSRLRTTFQQARAQGSWSKEVLREAAQHMSQDSDLTNMLSLALSEGALLRNGGREVCTLMYDTRSAKWAPRIYEFVVPKDSLITPETAGLGALDAYRSKSETEVLFYGSGLGRYVTRWRENPYTLGDQTRIQRPADEEQAPAPGAREKGPEDWGPAVRSGAVRNVDFRKVGKDWQRVRPRMAALQDGLPQERTAAVADLLKRIEELANQGWSVHHTRKLREVDEEILALSGSAQGSEGELAAAWTATLQDYLAQTKAL